MTFGPPLPPPPPGKLPELVFFGPIFLILARSGSHFGRTKGDVGNFPGGGWGGGVKSHLTDRGQKSPNRHLEGFRAIWMGPGRPGKVDAGNFPGGEGVQKSPNRQPWGVQLYKFDGVVRGDCLRGH